MIVKAYGKLNLGLCVVDKRADGFHTLKSILATVDVFDLITVELTDKHDRAEVIFENFPLLNGADNSAKAAADTFLRLSDEKRGVDISIKKNIPYCGGMGGSSADAAGVIFALAHMLDNDKNGDKAAISAAKAGSDVAALLCGGFCECEGRGERAKKLLTNRQFYFVVAEGEGSDTKTVFAAFDKFCSFGDAARYEVLKSALLNGENIKNLVFNDLKDACCFAYPNQKNFFEKCFRAAESHPMLTGSGSSVYWVCDSEVQAQSLCKKLSSSKINAFVCRSVDVGTEQC